MWGKIIQKSTIFQKFDLEAHNYEHKWQADLVLNFAIPQN
jgi:hypothetical protein